MNAEKEPSEDEFFSPGEKRRSGLVVWLGAGDAGEGRIIDLVQYSLSDATGVGDSVVSSDHRAAEKETLDAACWLMPTLSRTFIAEVLQLNPATDD